MMDMEQTRGEEVVARRDHTSAAAFSSHLILGESGTVKSSIFLWDWIYQLKQIEPSIVP